MSTDPGFKPSLNTFGTFSNPQPCSTVQSLILHGMQQRTLELALISPQLLGLCQAKESTTPTVLPHEHMAGPLLAYRVWSIKFGTGLLRSTGIGGLEWPFAVPMAAQCLRIGHHAPQAGCECGYYTVTNWDKAHKLSKSMVCIFGRAAIWGKVIKHQDGYRSEYAYPYELFLPNAPMTGFPRSSILEQEIKAIQDHYGCVVTVGMPHAQTEAARP